MNSKFEWVSHPVQDNDSKMNILAYAGVLIIIFGGFMWLGFAGILLALVIILLTLTPYFVPTKYSIDSEGVTVKYLFQRKQYPWHRFRNYYADSKGILLSPFERPSRLENFRGIYVRYGRYKEEVTDIIEYYMNDEKDSQDA
ncbi:MAG: hypothetical protein SVK54_05090 [candidate division WOR-3 bacterium]|nr:hypothetical protein [candidate division WOR-3 bacterium]